MRLWDTGSIKKCFVQSKYVKCSAHSYTGYCIAGVTDWGTRLQETGSLQGRGGRWAASKVLRGWLTSSATVHCLGMEMETGRVSCWLEKDIICLSHLQNGQEVTGEAEGRWTHFGPCMEQVLLEDISGPVKGKAFGSTWLPSTAFADDMWESGYLPQL